MGLNLLNSVFVMIIGMCVVFIGLVILIGATKLMSGILKRGKKKEDAPGIEIAESAPQEIEDEPVEDETSDEVYADGQLIAVISAALMAMENSGKRLVVRSVRRVGAQSSWANAGRREQINY